MSKPSSCFFYILALLIGIQTACSDSTTESTPIRSADGVILNPSTGKWQESDTPPLEFELVETIDLSHIEEPVISSLGYLRIDKEGNFYFYDRNIHQLISLDPVGNLRWAVGQEGKGPGDFENPFGMDLYNDKIYVMNVQGSRLDEFTMDGSFIRSISIPKSIQYPSLVGIREDGEMLLSGVKFGTVGTEIFTVQLGDSLKLTGNFSIIETNDEKYQRATTRGGISMTEDAFYYSFSTDYRFNIYGYDGELKTQVDREFDGVLGPGIYAVEGSVSMYSLGSIGQPVILDDGNYLIGVRYPTNIKDPNEYARRASTGETDSPEYAEFLDLYSADHELLYTINDSEYVDALGSLSVRDSEGYYYSPFSSDLQIKKYSIRTFEN